MALLDAWSIILEGKGNKEKRGKGKGIKQRKKRLVLKEKEKMWEKIGVERKIEGMKR